MRVSPELRQGELRSVREVSGVLRGGLRDFRFERSLVQLHLFKSRNLPSWDVDIKLPGTGNSNCHGARPVYSNHLDG